MSAKWFLARDKKKLGSYSKDQLKKLASVGHVQRTDRVQEEGESAWILAHKIPWKEDKARDLGDTFFTQDEFDSMNRK